MAKEILVEELTYEQALEELEKILEELENGKHGLNESLSLFERGQALTARCTTLLDQAELKVQELTEEGELKDFEA